VGKVTSKLQVTVPRTVADRLGIVPGDDLEWRVEGDAATVRRTTLPRLTLDERRAILDDMIRRDEARARARRGDRPAGRAPRRHRGWTRQDLYTRGRAG
jgi:bifunctional DNA-binding transcriptional regulator/antitoxin component of YhaV-PrlF toxin-antitoxin module